MNNTIEPTTKVMGTKKSVNIAAVVDADSEINVSGKSIIFFSIKH